MQSLVALSNKLIRIFYMWMPMAVIQKKDVVLLWLVLKDGIKRVLNSIVVNILITPLVLSEKP